MSFIKYIPYGEAGDELKKLYDAYGGADKTPANILRIAGLNPAAMKAHADLYRAIMFGPSPLSRAQREMIAVTVSALNKCHY
jgi:alkylhydroperoxidase family enzyme